MSYTRKYAPGWGLMFKNQSRHTSFYADPWSGVGYKCLGEGRLSWGSAPDKAGSRRWRPGGRDARVHRGARAKAERSRQIQPNRSRALEINVPGIDV